MGEVRVTQDDRILFSYLLGWDVTDNEQRILDGHFDQHVKMQKIARHRQAAEKAQQERDAKVAQERAEAYHAIPRVNVLNAARAGEAERIATAIRSQGHE